MSDNKLEIPECVERAVQLLPEGGEPVVSDGTDEYSLLLRRLCLKVRVWDQTDEQLEEKQLELLIHQSLTKASDEGDNPIEAFHQDLQTKLSSDHNTHFRLAFPLNIRETQDEPAPRSMAAGTTDIQKIQKDQWDGLVDTAKQSGTTSEEELPLEEFLEQSTDKVVSDRHNVFYAFEAEARSPAVAVSLLKRDLDIILGKLNFVAVDSTLGQSALEELRSDERSLPDIILRPCMYLVFEGDECENVFVNSIPDSYTGFRLPRGFGADFEDFRSFPVAAANEPVDPAISDAFRALQAGLAASTNENAFLYFWRGIEEITLHERSGSSEDALNRTLPLVHREFDLEILESITEDLAEKRNDIVHTGVESPVYVRDVNLLRRLLFLSIEEVFSLRQEGYSRTEMLGVLKRGLNAEGQLEQAENGVKKEREEKEDTLKEIEGARRWQRERALAGSAGKLTQRS